MFRAYHASPHKFDLFDNSFIGTGEGKQMYGWGLYFTQTLAVARYYQKTLAKKLPPLYYDDKRVSFVGLGRILGFDVADRTKDLGYQWRCLDRIIGDSHAEDRPVIDVAQEEARRHARGGDLSSDPIARLFLEIGKQLTGHLRFGGSSTLVYEVMIDTDMDHLLNADGPCSDYVQQKLEGVLKRYRTGWDVYMAFDRRYEDHKRASLALAALGISGMRYLDQLSREIGEGSHNYVIYDPRIITIKRRFKLAG